MSVFERRQQTTALKRFSVTSSTSSVSCLTSLMRDNDVVKRGCLHMKRPPSNSTVKLRIKAWQKRYLVLRDAWTPDGETTLELHDTDPTSSMIASTVSFSSIDDITSIGVGARAVGSRGRRHYVINLRTVMYVDVYQESKSFPNAFIVFRTGKSPLIFGAKTDLEMREWMMAIKLLADKLRTRSSVRDGTANSIIESRRQRQRQPDTGTATGELTPPVAARRRSDMPPFAVMTSSTSPRVASRDDVMRRSTPQLMTSSPSSCSPKIQQHQQQQMTSTSPRSTDKLFPVRMQHYTDPGMARRLHGEYVLAVGDVDISLRHCRSTRSTDDIFNDSDDVIVRWLLRDIRKLKCESCDDGFGDVITLVAMSNSPTLDGATYQFRTGCGLNVIRCVRQLVRKLDPNATTARSRDDLTSVGGGMAVTSSSNVGHKRVVSSVTSQIKSSVVATWSTASNTGVSPSTSRSQPDLLNSRDDDYVDDGGISGFHSSDEQLAQTNGHSAVNGDFDGGAFYLPLIDDPEDLEPADTETDEDRVTSVLTAASWRHVTLSKSTGALNSYGLHGAVDTQHNNNSIIIGGAGWISPEAPPRPPPRPVHTISSFDAAAH